MTLINTPHSNMRACVKSGTWNRCDDKVTQRGLEEESVGGRGCGLE